VLRPEAIAAVQLRERAARLLALGALLICYGAVWLLLAFRASRVGETECTVVQLPNGYCTVHHVEHGTDYMLPWSDCSNPRWSSFGPARIGEKLHCYYYSSSPDDIFFEKRETRTLFPIPIAVLGLGLVLRIIGELERRKAAKPIVEAPRDPYRDAEAPEPDPRPPLEVPMDVGGLVGGIIGWIFLVLGGIVTLLSFYLAWIVGGEPQLAALFFFALGNLPVIAGAYLAFHRSGLVFDPSQGTVLRWWGLRGRWFDSTRALADLEEVAVKHSSWAGGGMDYIVLTFGDGRRWSYLAPLGKAHTEVGRINDYLYGPSEPERKHEKRKHASDHVG
jgi:hypothetical protein